MMMSMTPTSLTTEDDEKLTAIFVSTLGGTVVPENEEDDKDEDDEDDGSNEDGDNDNENLGKRGIHDNVFKKLQKRCCIDD